MTDKRRERPKTKLYYRDIFSTRRAAVYAGVALSTFRNHIRDGRIEPIWIGERRTGNKSGEISPNTMIFTRRMLDYYKSGEYETVRPFDVEIKQIFDFKRAAEYLGVSPSALQQAYHTRGTLGGVTIGGAVLFLRPDLDEYRRRKNKT